MTALLRAELAVWFRTKENLFWAIAWPILWLGLVSAVFPALPGRTKAETLAYYYPSGIVLILLSASLTGLAIKLAIAKEQRELLRIQIVPIAMSTFLAAQFFASAVFAVLAILVFSAVAFALGVRIPGNLGFGAILIALGMVAFSSIAFLIAGVARRTSQANLASIITMFAMMFLSSLFFDLSLAPSLIRSVSHVLPGGPLCDALRASLFEGAPLKSYASDLAVLVAWAVLGSSLSAATFRVQ